VHDVTTGPRRTVPLGRDRLPSIRMIRPDLAVRTFSRAAYLSVPWFSVSDIRQKYAMSGPVADAGPVQWREADDHWSKR
jgi:hypothetical protein